MAPTRTTAPWKPLGDVSVKDGQRDRPPDIDRPKPDAGDATL
ncbi:hypothetical protein [Azospirillum soli]|nr:hypothetical protein [Azospirillum soli]MBP2316048.1 hypothetical protein [Azospirillum soli]